MSVQLGGESMVTRVRWTRSAVAGVAGIVVACGVLWGPVTAGAASVPVISFNAALQEAQLTIPSSACAAASPGCEWMLYVNEPGVSGQPAVDEVTGTAGTLSIPYPPNFCGVIQADALLGPGHWAYQTGTRMEIDTCPGPDTGAATLPFTEAASTTPAAAAASQTSAYDPVKATATAAKLSSLPFTGMDLGPMLAVGFGLCLAGAWLVADPRLRRRTLAGVGRGTGMIFDWLFGA